MDMSEAKSLFFEEAMGLLETMESCLLEIESGEASVDSHIDAIFRAAHTIKGSAGLFGYDHIVAFTHSVESVLDKVRSRELAMEEALINLCFASQDHLTTMIQQLQDSSIELDFHAGELLLVELNRYLAPAPVVAEVRSEPVQSSENWQIDIQYGPDVFRDGMDPLSQLGFLSTLGQLQQVRLLPHFKDDFDPETCYLQLFIELSSAVSKKELEDVFEFIQDSSKIQITVPAKITQQLEQQEVVDEKLGTLLVQAGAVTERELAQALQVHKVQEIALGEALVQQGVVSKDMVSTALDKQKSTEHKRPADFQFLKVEAKKLDLLINLIGELVTSGAEMDTLLSQLEDDKITESFSILTSLLEQIRDGALGLRMVQIGESFSRLRRIVRDVSKELDKDINLMIDGAETELD
ncbi:MAG: Hpt domain-containing protein, partial [Pararheinheimera sp.]|nr:Hpt domain-containing protein [Rheinheimera sp.]